MNYFLQLKLLYKRIFIWFDMPRKDQMQMQKTPKQKVEKQTLRRTSRYEP